MSEQNDYLTHSGKIPVIVLNWNNAEDTIECIVSLLTQSYPDYEIYLADNGSGKTDADRLRERYGDNPKIRLVFFDENHGFAKAHNLLFEEILKINIPKYIALLNNDAVADRRWLENLVWSAEKHSAQMISSCMINYYDREMMDSAGHFILNTGEIIPVGSGKPTAEFQLVKENEGACAGAALYSSEMLKKIGTFDEYFHTGYEDAELGLRAMVTGHRLIYEPSAIAYHKVSRSVSRIMNYSYTLKIQLNIYYSYLKLMPVSIILFNLFPFLFKCGSILLIDVLFIRPKFLKVFLHSLFLVVFRDSGVILRKRKVFYARKLPMLSFREIQNRLTSFLWFDIMRFYKYVLLKQKTQFEKY